MMRVTEGAVLKFIFSNKQSIIINTMTFHGGGGEGGRGVWILFWNHTMLTPGVSLED